jgi:hypothetical protein
MDEFHLFLKSDAVLDFLMSIWKRARKFGGGPTGITQNISDLLKSQAAETIFSNSSLIVMLNQAPGDRAALARLLNISETQQQYINNARKGSGLIWTGQAIIPFMDDFPQNTRLYQMMSTNATESLAEAVTSEKMSRNRQELSAKEKEDEEYAEYQKQQSELYKDQAPITPPQLEDDGINDMDDYPDDGFGPDPFAIAFSDGGFKDNDDDDDIVVAGNEEFPDEFDATFGGGVDSMFKASKPTTSLNKPAQPEKPKDKAQDALDAFFNI